MLLVDESTGLDFETSCKDVSLTDELTIGNSGTLGKAFDQKRLKPMRDSTIPLTDAALALAARGTPVSYRALWGAVVEGRVPAQRVGARWVVRSADLATIADRLSSRNAA